VHSFGNRKRRSSRYEAIIEVDVVSDEYPVVHEPHEAVRDLGEYRRAADHLVRDARDLGYLGRDGSLRIHQGMPLVDDLMVADLHRADFGYPIAGRPTARRLDVDHDVVLLRIEPIIDPADLRANAGASELPQPSELVAADHVALGLDLHEGDGAVFLQHEIREPVAHVAEVPAQQADDGCDPLTAGSRQQQPQRVDIDVVPGEDAVRTAPFRGDRAQQQFERAS
jgi:hypothetical protein